MNYDGQKDIIERLKTVYGSPEPTLKELKHLNHIRGLFEQVSHGFLSLNYAIVNCFDLAPGSKLSLSQRSNPSQNEKNFAYGVVGAIGFILNFGIGIGFFCNILQHDLEEINRHGTLDEAIKTGFWPKAMGWAQEIGSWTDLVPSLN
jgi:hypothetical protein